MENNKSAQTAMSENKEILQHQETDTFVVKVNKDSNQKQQNAVKNIIISDQKQNNAEDQISEIITFDANDSQIKDERKQMESENENSHKLINPTKSDDEKMDELTGNILEELLVGTLNETQNELNDPMTEMMNIELNEKNVIDVLIHNEVEYKQEDIEDILTSDIDTESESLLHHEQHSQTETVTFIQRISSSIKESMQRNPSSSFSKLDNNWTDREEEEQKEQKNKYNINDHVLLKAEVSTSSNVQRIRSSIKSKENEMNNMKLSNAKNCKYNINDFVLLKKNRKGIIRFIGNVHFTKGTLYGIELKDGSFGKHDGMFRGQRYFQTAEKYKGVFVKKVQIIGIL